MDNITEGLNYGDLQRLIQPVFGIDQYKSKMGDDKDVCVVSFTVFGKEPANDLANFVEKSYDWILDADVSSGELSDGNYIVFLEIERTKQIPGYLTKFIEDMRSVAKMKEDEWSFKYYQSIKKHPATAENFARRIACSPEKWDLLANEVVEESKARAQLNSIRAIAQIKVPAPEIDDVQLKGLQIMSGIK